jgi:tetratricopeptide (TPR) repeat protein
MQPNVVAATEPDFRAERPRLLGAILLLAVLVYAPNLGHPFQYDDIGKVLHNPKLLDPLGYLAAFRGEGYSEETTRLIPNLTFSLNYALFGWNSFGYHLTNLLFHLANIWLLALLGQAVLRRLGQKAGVIPLLAAAIFAVHPLNSEAVNYCNARPNVMAATFYLLSLLGFLRALESAGERPAVRVRRWCLFAAALVAALLSKERAVTVVLMAPLLAVWIEGARPGNYAGARRAIGLAAAGLVAVGIVSLFLTGAYNEIDRVVFRMGSEISDNWVLSRVLVMLGQATILMKYFGLALLPLPAFLSVDHAEPALWAQVRRAGGDAGGIMALLAFPLFSALVLLAVIGAAVALRRRVPFVSFFLLWPFIGHAPSTIMPRGEVMVEYRTYLPMAGVCLLLAWALTRVSALLPARVEFVGRHRRPTAAVGVALLLGALATGTAVRNRAWASEYALWRDAASKAPHSPRALSNLGKELAKQEKKEEAIDYLERALRINPDFADAHNGMAALLVMRGEVDRAADHLRKALRYTSGNVDALNNLGNALTQKGLLDEATAVYERALSRKPHAPDTHNNLGMALYLKGNVQEAIDHYRRALRIAPDLAEARYNLGMALSSLGKREQAIEQLRYALRIDPGYAKAYNNLGVALAAQGKIGQAIESYRKALSIQRENAQAHYNLGVALGAQGKLDEAARHYARALNLQPDYAEAHTNLGIIQFRQGKPARAAEHYRRALKIKPELFQANLNLAIALGAQGRLEEALQWCHRALGIDPDHRLARRTLEMLESRLEAGQPPDGQTPEERSE